MNSIIMLGYNGICAGSEVRPCGMIYQPPASVLSATILWHTFDAFPHERYAKCSVLVMLVFRALAAALMRRVNTARLLNISRLLDFGR